MRILFAGSKDRGVRCLEALLETDHDVVGVVSESEDDPDAFWDGSVVEAATELDLPLFTPKDVNDQSFIGTVRDIGPSLMVMSGFSQVLGAELLAAPSEGVINLHAGKLPDYRGGSPMNWAIINGESHGTATIHYATEKIDAGAVLSERRFPISRDDTIVDVREHTLEIFPEMLVNVVDAIERGDVSTREVDITDGTYWGSRVPDDGFIAWSEMTARNVYDRVRALTHPYPGAFTKYDGERLYVWSAALLEETIKHEPGRICMKRGEGRVVAAKDRGILLETVQRESGEQQPAATALDRGEYLG